MFESQPFPHLMCVVYILRMGVELTTRIYFLLPQGCIPFEAKAVESPAALAAMAKGQNFTNPSDLGDGERPGPPFHELQLHTTFLARTLCFHAFSPLTIFA